MGFMKPLLVTVRESGPPILASHPDGFPVDGDARDHGSRTLAKRAVELIAADPALLAAARTWLGGPLHPSDAELTPAQVAHLVQRLYCGGAARFIAWVPAALVAETA